MMARRPLLVGVDGSDPSDAALRWAAHEAFLRGAGLFILHAFVPSSLPVGARHDLDWEEAHRLVDTAHHKAERTAPGVHVRSKVVAEDPPIALVRRSAEADLLVLGTHGHGGFHDLVAGSVALKAAGHAACPVVLVHAGWRPPVDDREIVVGVGGDAALDAAFIEAEVRGVPLRAVRAWRPIMPAGPTGLTPLTLAELERGEQVFLTRVLVPWRKRHPDVSVIESVVCGSVRHALVTSSRQAQLLVFGVREHFGAHTLALSTTAHTLIHHVPCPVLVTREHRHHRPWARETLKRSNA